MRVIFTREVTVAIYQRPNIFLPAGEPLDLAWLEEDFVHELAHHLTGHESTFFMKEGIATATAEAVFGGSGRVPDAWPLFGRTTDAWVALMAERSHLLPMATALAWPRYRNETAESDFQSWKVYLQAGSVVGWDVRTRGYGAFMKAFERGRFDVAPEVLEGRWRTAVARGRPASFDPATQLPDRPRYQDFARRLSRAPSHSILRKETTCTARISLFP